MTTIQRTTPSFFSPTYLPSSLPGRAVAITLVALAALATYLLMRRVSRPLSAIEQKPIQPIEPTVTHQHIELLGNRNNEFLEDKTYEGSDDGIIDFAITLPSIGVGCITNAQGHGLPKIRSQVVPILQQFLGKLLQALRNTPDFTTEQLHNVLLGLVINLSYAYENTTRSAFTLARLTQNGNQKFVTVVHVGNSSLFHIDAHKKVSLLTPPSNTSCLGQAKKKEDFFVATYKVQEGDRIIGVTDGVTKALKGDELKQILLKGDSSHFADFLKADLQAKVRADRSLQDDYAFFQFVVP